jgi:hypothetical protein
MSLFEFLMILLSIIVGLGISELLSGVARIVRAGQLSELCLAHASLLLTLFVVLLQIFWESWSLSILTTWTFTAMLLMLATPVLLYLVTHIVLPADGDEDLVEYYFRESRFIYSLLAFAAVVSVLFRPLAFGYPLFVVDNLSTFPTIAALVLLAWSRNPVLHRILVPLCFLGVLLDTVTISYEIQ